MNLKAVAIIVLVTTLTGCVTPFVIPLTKQTQKNIDQVEGILIIPQKNLGVTINGIPSGAPPLIGVVLVLAIDLTRLAIAKNEAAPILAELHDYDFRKVMLDASTEALSKIGKLKFVTPLRVETVDSDSIKRNTFDKSSASALLFCDISYGLVSGDLVVTAFAKMYPKTADLKQFRVDPDDSNPIDKGNVIYRNMFKFTRQGITPANIKKSLAEAASTVARQLAADLNRGL